MVTVEPVGNPVTLGESPHWDDTEQVLYFVDILSGVVNKYDPATKSHTSVKVDDAHVSLVVPVEGKRDQFLIATKRNLAIMTWDGKSASPTKVDIVYTAHEDDGKQENKFNDGKVDPAGRFWAGTIGPFNKSLEPKNKGFLLSFSKDFKPTAHLTDVSISNGMTWSPDQKTMYFIDSFTRSVAAFDFNAQTGDISNHRVVFDLRKNNLEFIPDGITIDAEGKIWVAFYNGSQVVRVDPASGKLLITIKIPAPVTTAVAFGGANLDELYITTGRAMSKEDDLKKYPFAGCTFRVTGLGVKGLPGKSAQIA